MDYFMSTEEDDLTLEDIKRGAEFFKLLFKWQQESLEKNDNSEGSEEAS